MSIYYFKYLFYINRNSFTSVVDLKSAFNINDEDTQNILATLIQNGYIREFKNTLYFPTPKGKHFLPSALLEWLLNNLLSIIAIIVSIIALFNN